MFDEMTKSQIRESLIRLSLEFDCRHLPQCVDRFLPLPKSRDKMKS